MNLFDMTQSTNQELINKIKSIMMNLPDSNLIKPKSSITYLCNKIREYNITIDNIDEMNIDDINMLEILILNYLNRRMKYETP